MDFLRLWAWDFTPNPWVHSVSFGSQGPVRLTNGRSRSSRALGWVKRKGQEPDPERARHLSAVRMAIVKLERLVAPLPEN